MKAFLGEPIGTFIVRTRTEAAARLLRYSDIPIADIAYRIGYASPSSLSKVFKQFYGISPLEYRNNKNFVIMKPAIIRPDLELKREIRNVSERNVIYIRLTGDYKLNDYGGTWGRLFQFIKEQKLPMGDFNMHRAGIEHVILIRCGYRRWQTFSSQVLTSEERCYEPPADLVGMFLRLSEKWGMKFWFGLYDSGKYWASGDYLHEVELNCRLIDEVWARYGHHAAFGGWYISQECSRNTGKIIDLYARLGRHCKAVSGGLPTLISPYIDGSKNISQYTDRTTRTGGVTAESHEAEWDAIFRGIQGAVDIVAFQDGHVEYDELPEFLRINKRLADRYGLECWTNTETFDRDMPIKFLPIKWEKLRLKLRMAEEAGIDQAITFEFSHFMSPQSAYLQAGHLYDRYLEYLNTSKK